MATWLITGCSTGLGRALARGRARSAATTPSSPPATSRRCRTSPTPTRTPPSPLPLDVTDDAQVTAAVAAAEERFGGVDVLVNNAGYGYRAAVEEGDDDDVQQLFDTHVFGTVRTIKAVLPGMRARRSGTIVNLSSIGARISPGRVRLLRGGQGRDRGADAVAAQGGRPARHHRDGRRARRRSAPTSPAGR